MGILQAENRKRSWKGLIGNEAGADQGLKERFFITLQITLHWIYR